MSHLGVQLTLLRDTMTFSKTTLDRATLSISFSAHCHSLCTLLLNVILMNVYFMDVIQKNCEHYQQHLLNRIVSISLGLIYHLGKSLDIFVLLGKG